MSVFSGEDQEAVKAQVDPLEKQREAILGKIMLKTPPPFSSDKVGWEKYNEIRQIVSEFLKKNNQVSEEKLTKFFLDALSPLGSAQNNAAFYNKVLEAFKGLDAQSLSVSLEAESEQKDPRGELQEDGGFLNKDGNYYYYTEATETEPSYGYCTNYHDKASNMWLYQYYDSEGNTTELKLKDAEGRWASIEQVAGKGSIKQSVVYKDANEKVQSIHLYDNFDLNSHPVRVISLASLKELQKKAPESEAEKIGSIISKFEKEGKVEDVNELAGLMEKYMATFREVSNFQQIRGQLIALNKNQEDVAIRKVGADIVKQMKVSNFSGEELKGAVQANLKAAVKQIKSIKLSKVDKEFYKPFVQKMERLRVLSQDKKVEFESSHQRSYSLIVEELVEKTELFMRKNNLKVAVARDIKILELEIKNNPSKVDKANYRNIVREMKESLKQIQSTSPENRKALENIEEKHNNLVTEVNNFIAAKHSAERDVKNLVKEVSALAKIAPRGPDSKYYNDFLKEIKDIKKEVDLCINMKDVGKLRSVRSELEKLVTEHEKGMKEKLTSLRGVSSIVREVEKARAETDNKADKQFYKKGMSELVSKHEKKMIKTDVRAHNWGEMRNNSIKKHEEMKSAINAKRGLMAEVSDAITAFKIEHKTTLEKIDKKGFFYTKNQSEKRVVGKLKALERIEKEAKKTTPGVAIEKLQKELNIALKKAPENVAADKKKTLDL